MTAGARSALASLFFVSAAILTLELYWVRAFAESEWGHLASMVVSTAMLGIGAGGTFVLLAGDRLVADEARSRVALLVAFLVLAALGPLIVRQLPFEPLLLLWRPSAWLWVILREAVIAAGFAAAGAVVALAFRVESARPGTIYAVNLLGSASGVALALALMAHRPTSDLHVAAMVAAVFSLAAALPGPRLRRIAVVASAAIWVALASRWSEPSLHPTKDLAAALRLPDARIVEEQPGVPGRWTVVESSALHFAPGLSLIRSEPVGPQRALFLRGDGAGAIFRAGRAGVLRHRVAWLPYAVRPPGSILTLGDPSLLEIQTALLAGVPRVVAAIPDPRTRQALRKDLGAFSGVAGAPVELRSGGPRAVLSSSEPIDLVVIPPEDSLAASSAGLGTAQENDLLTVEGIAAALRATSSRGQLCVQRWTQAPPRDLPRLSATVARALRDLDIEEPRTHVALVQTWDAWILCASRSRYDPAERARLLEFAREHGFDVLVPPSSGELQHRLPGPDPAALVERALAGKPPPADYPFRVDPVGDDRPFFHHFLSYGRLLPYLEALRDGSIPASEWGDFFLWASLCSAVLLGGALVAVPPLVAAGPRRVLAAAGRDTLLFACLGLGYMFLEILFLHQGTKISGLPALSAAVVLLAFLSGSALGAGWISRVGERGSAGPAAALLSSAGALAAALGLEPLLESALGLPPLLRWGALFLPALALAIPLGMPFPAGLARSGRLEPAVIPWLVGVNGWTSVIGAVLASLVAIAGGFSLVGFSAAALYAIATVLLSLRRSGSNGA